MRISDWSSDVCSSDLRRPAPTERGKKEAACRNTREGRAERRPGRARCVRAPYPREAGVGTDSDPAGPLLAAKRGAPGLRQGEAARLAGRGKAVRERGGAGMVAELAGQLGQGGGVEIGRAHV